MKQDHQTIMKIKSIIELLLTHEQSRQKMKFNATDKRGLTAFDKACFYGLLPVVKVFLKYKDQCGIDTTKAREMAEKYGWKGNSKLINLLDRHNIV